MNREKIVASAQKFIQRGQLDKAIKEFQRIVEEDPKDVRTLLKIGDLFSKKGERDNAIQTYLKVAEFYSEQGFFLKAVAVYKQILKVDPALIDVNVKLADLYGQLGLGSDALAQYQNVALYYEKAAQTPKVLQILRKMVDLDPSNVGIRIKLAELFAKEGQNKEATEEFKEAARVLKEQNRLADYAKVGERILFLDPDNLVLAKELAEMYLKSNDVKRALAKLQVCFKADPRDIPVLEMLAGAFLALGQTPKTVSVYRELAKIHADKGEFDKRRQYLKSILELQPDDEETRAELELRAQAPKAPPPQEERVGSARTDRPAPPQPLQTTAAPLKPQEMIAKLLTETDVYVKYGLKDKALEHLKKIFSLAPDNLDAHAKVRDIYLQVGDTDGAVSTLMTMADIAVRTAKSELAEGWLREVLRLAPDHDDASAKLKELTPEEILDDEMIVDTPHDDEGGVELVVDEGARDEDPLPPLPDEAFDDRPGPSEGVSLEVDDDAGAEMPIEMPEVPGDEAQTALDDEDSSGVFDDEHDDLEDLTAGDEDDEPVSASIAAPPVEDDGLDLDLGAAAHEPPASGDELDFSDADLGVDVDPQALGAKERAAPKSTVPVQSGEARTDPKPRVQSGESSVERELPQPPEASFDAEPTGESPTFGLDAEASSPSPEEEAPSSQAPADEPEPDVEDELGEAEFFEQQGLEDEAIDVYKNVLKKAPRNAIARQALARLGIELEAAPSPKAAPPPPADGTAKVAPIARSVAPKTTSISAQARVPSAAQQKPITAEKKPPPPAPKPQAPVAEKPTPKVAGVTKSLINEDALGGDGFDLASELAEDFADATSSAAEPPDDMQFSVEDVLSEFKKGVAATVSEGDYATHYDLGIAYKEMGLVDEAVREFEISSRAPQKQVESLSMIGVCKIELGDPKGAIEALKKASNSDRISAQQSVALQYELANAHAAAGDPQTARTLFAKVAKLDPKFRDAAARASAAGQDEGGGDDGDENPPPGGAPPKKGKISYL